VWSPDTSLPSALREQLKKLARSARRVADPAMRAGGDGGWCRTWRFPSLAGAERWNEGWDEVLSRRELVHPALVRIRGHAIPDAFLEALARVAGTILAQEVQAGTPCPYMKCGWSYALSLEHDVPQAAPAGPVVVKLVGEVRDPDDALHWCVDASRLYSADLIPLSVAAEWSARPRPEVVEAYE
jgi:hypothetical protein